jgi:hypothetical protein
MEAYSQTMDEKSFVKIGLKPAVIPSGPGGAIISPMIVGAGKIF